MVIAHGNTDRFWLKVLATCIIVSTFLPHEAFARQHRFRTVHSFCQSPNYCPDGAIPLAGVTVDSAGVVYGTTYGGGPTGGGVVYQLQKEADGWKYTVLYSFCQLEGCADGLAPRHLILDVNGNLFGTTDEGGNTGCNCGTIFKLTPDANHSHWTLTTLYAFSGTTLDGGFPGGDLSYYGRSSGQLYDGAAPLYGTVTWFAAADAGGVYKLTHNGDGSWSEKLIYSFCSQANCSDGRNGSTGPLIVATPKKLFGNAEYGGNACAEWAWGCGTLYQLAYGDGQWKQTTLYRFCTTEPCADGDAPTGALAIDSSGALYGTTPYGGANKKGTIFKLVPNGVNSQEQVLHDFCIDLNCDDGALPFGGVTFDSSGQLVGTTEQAGMRGEGNIFSFNGTRLRVLHTFCGTPRCKGPREPQYPLTIAPDGSLWSATQVGGNYGFGTVFQLKR